MIIGIDIRSIGKKQTGGEAVFFNLVKNLALIDNKNEYKLFTDISEEAVISKIKKDLGIENKPAFEVISLVAVSPLRNKFGWNVWTLPKYLRKNPVDIYHTQYITPFFVPKRTKIVTVIHDISFNFFPQFIKLADLFFLKTLIPLSLKRADKIIAVSKFTCDEIVKYYEIDPRKSDWIYNAVADNFSKEDTLPEKLDTIRKKYDLPEKFILYIGTMQPRKNLPVMVEAYAKIKNIIPEIKLVLVGGKGAYNFDKNIGKTIHKFHLSADVVFPGFVPEEEKPAFFKLAKAFCFPSRYEGFGIPVLEAFAAGTPAVISDIAPHREIAGKGALFFDPKDTNDLAEKLKQIIQDENLRNKLVEKGKMQARKFSWKNSAEKMLDIYNKMTSIDRKS